MPHDDEPQRVDLAAKAAEVAARARITSAMPPLPLEDTDAPSDDPDVIARRRTQRAHAWSTIVPPRYGDPTLDKARTGGAPAEVVDDLAEWAANPRQNLVILGPVGTGKTFLAWAALRRAYGSGHSVRGIGVVDLLDSLRPSGDVVGLPGRSLRDVDLLLLDDLGAQRPTDWTGERLYALVHHRWEYDRPLVVTANLDPAGLAESLGPRSYSRLVDDALVIRLAGRDRRRPNSKDTP